MEELTKSLIEEDSKYNRSYIELIEILEKSVLKVTFTKADGSIREMKCTRNDYKISGRFRHKEYNKFNSQEEIAKDMMNKLVKVYDLEKKGHRSFKTERIINMIILEEL